MPAINLAPGHGEYRSRDDIKNDYESDVIRCQSQDTDSSTYL